MPIHLYFSDKIMAREYVKTSLEFDQVHSLEHNVAPFSLEAISFISALIAMLISGQNGRDIYSAGQPIITVYC